MLGGQELLAFVDATLGREIRHFVFSHAHDVVTGNTFYKRGRLRYLRTYGRLNDSILF
jgi:hypothetical protein